MKTFSLRKEDVTHRWFLVDATGQPLGRLARQVAQILRGKHKPTFTPAVGGGGPMSSGITPELRWHAVGRRKVGVARVYLTPGSGKWNINGRTLGDYFPRPSLVSHIQQPFTATDTLGAFDVRALCRGGGVTGQAGAARLGVARALVPGEAPRPQKQAGPGRLL